MGTYLGQNFLIDAKVRSYIADKIFTLYHALGCEVLIEIGPGKGSITKLIQTISPNFFVVDKDEQLIQNLEFRIQNSETKKKNIEIISGDILELDVDALLKEKNLSSEKTLVVGNLPYYITSPILRKFFGSGEQKYVGGIFMVQDEVGQKLKSDAKKKSYLRRLLNYAYTVTYLKGVPAKCFKPAPKVKSCLIECRIKNSECRIEWNRLIEFLELFAPFSRKTLGAIQKMIKKKSDISFEIPPEFCSKRLEALTWDELTAILGNKETRD